MRIASTHGVDVELHDLGGRGPLLLVSHATGMCVGPYRPLAAELADHFHVWALDYRGHGDSTLPDHGSLAWSGMCDDLLACLDVLDAGPITAVGHSMGGAVVLMAALARPERFRAIYGYEPVVPPEAAPDGFGGPDNLMSSAARRRRPTFPSRAEALARYASRPPLSLLRADALWGYVEQGFADLPDGSVTLKCTPESEARTFESAGQLGADCLHHMEVPTMIAVGGVEKEVTPGRFADELVAALPRAQLVEYEHLGHFGPLQDPVTVARDIIAFADRHRH